MPVYASTQGFADQARHPRALMLIVGGHAVLVAAVMTAKMEVIPLAGTTKTVVELIEEVKLPPPLPPEPAPPRPEHPVSRTPHALSESRRRLTASREQLDRSRAAGPSEVRGPGS